MRITMLLVALLAPAIHAQERPNVILVMTDDQGYGDLSYHLNPVLQTPAMDRLAREGARLERFYVSPVCAPTRACLMTGRYNYRTGVVDTYNGRAMMRTDEVTIAECLRDAGYATGLFGKWHLGDNHPLRPQDQGFDKTLVHRGGGIGQPSDPIGAEKRYTDPVLFANGLPVKRRGYCTGIYFDEAMGFIRQAQRDRRPFFAYIATNAPHGPFGDVPEDLRLSFMEHPDLDKALRYLPESEQATEKALDRLARIFAMVADIDRQLGRLLTFLDERDLTRDTIVIFMVDNGPNSDRYTVGYRDRKCSVYEGGVRSPFFFRWPARVKAGTTSAELSAHIDVLPTLLSACGVEPRDEPALDGRNLMPLILGKDISWPDRTLFIQSHRGNKPVQGHHASAIGSRYKLVRASGFHTEKPKSGASWELYDLRADRSETRDLSAEKPGEVARLRRAYDTWFADVAAGTGTAPRISLGHPTENPLMLTRQDWRHESGKPWGRGSGFWGLDVLRSGHYEFRGVLRPPARRDGTATLSLANGEIEVAVKAGARVVVFDSVALKKGPFDLHVVVRDGKKREPYQMRVRRL